MTKYFDKKYLKEELDLPWTAIEDEIVDTGRWNEVHDIVFQDNDGTYWSTFYSCGKTEYQDEAPWEYEDKIKCVQVEKRQVAKEEWVAIDD